MENLNINDDVLAPEQVKLGLGSHWNANTVRQTFIDFFKKKNNHTFVKSSPVVPHNDPTLLFANAGMNQFKPIFLGQVDPSDPRAQLKRAVNSQKCIRAGGKHNDLDDVGKDLTHHTFFEMLGNWSFGDFGKKDIIDWSWELLTKEFGLDPARLYATYYQGDENGEGCDTEAKELWEKHLPPSHVLPFDAKENFWEMGDTGPCGPCSEISYDTVGNRDVPELVNNDDDPSVVEIWNLVFMTKNRRPDGTLEDLPFANVDTGMGFERLVSILQDKRSNYDTDVFSPLFKAIKEIAGVEQEYSGKIGEADVGNVDMAYRVVADHIRTLSISITDGAVPSNLGRGYVLRRVLRRAVRYGQEILNIEPLFLSKLVPVVVECMKEAYPELQDKMHFVQEVLLDEEITFQRTLKKGVDYFNREVERMLKEGRTQVSGEMCFFLYGTMGFPVDLTELMAEEKGLTANREEFEQLLEKEKEASRLAGKARAGEGRNLGAMEAKHTSLLDSKNVSPTIEDSKYEWHVDVKGKVVAFFDGENIVDDVTGDKLVGVMLDRSNFYAESGGQLPDHGTLELSNGAEFVVENCQTYAGYILHIGTLKDTSSSLKIGDEVTCKVDFERRQLLANNHTATHVLNLGLRKVLGADIDQKGSLVAVDKLRFDFNSQKAVTAQQLKQVEEVVTNQISEALPVYTKVVPLAQAKAVKSLRAVFGETYPDPVRVVVVGKPVEEVIADPDNEEWMNYSVELCGGTHLRNSADAKAFALIEESGIAKGVRRVVAVTGEDALESIQLAETLTAKVNEAEFIAVTELEEVAKQLTAEINEARISAHIKDELRNKATVLTRKAYDHKKALKDNAMKAAKKECTDLANDAKAAGEKYIVALLNQPGDAAAKLVQDLAKAVPELSYMIMQRDEAKGKLLIASIVNKEHNVSAKDWLAAVNKVTNGKGGGKPNKANGQSDIATADAAKSAADEFAKSSFA